MAEAGPEERHSADLAPEREESELSDLTQGESFNDLEGAVTRALDAMPRGMLPWVCCDKKFVLSPEDISTAHAQFKEAAVAKGHERDLKIKDQSPPAWASFLRLGFASAGY